MILRARVVENDSVLLVRLGASGAIEKTPAFQRSFERERDTAENIVEPSFGEPWRALQIESENAEQVLGADTSLLRRSLTVDFVLHVGQQGQGRRLATE